MSNIPLARSKLLAFKNKLEDVLKSEFLDEIDDIMALLVREQPIRTTKPKCNSITPKLVEEVELYFKRHRSASMFEIAKRFNINGGRVSEIVNGRYSVDRE